MFDLANSRWNIKPEVALKVLVIAGASYWLLQMLGTLKSLIIILLAGFVFSLLTEPIVAALERKKISRVFGSLIIIVLFLGILSLILSQLFPLILAQTRELIEKIIQLVSNLQSGQLPEGLEFLKRYEGKIQETISQQITSTTLHAPAHVSNAGEFLLNFISKVFGKIIYFIFFIIVSLFFLQKPKTLENILEPFLKKKYIEEILHLLEVIRKKLGKWLIGQTILAGIMSIAVFIILTILQVPFALTIAIAGFLAEYTPYIGIFVIGSVAFPALIEKGVSTTLIFLAAYVGCNWTKENILTPLVMRKIIGLHPLVIFLSMLICAKLIGVFGVLLAVPIATVIKILFEEYGVISPSKLPEKSSV